MSSPVFQRFARGDWPRVEAFLLGHGEPVEHAKSVLAHEEVVAWLALEGGEIVGWILTHLGVSGDGAQRGFVEDLVVALGHRGRGLARRLMELAETYYRERGFGGMQLTVRANNEAALRLYQSLGYITIEERLRMWKDFT